MRASLLAALLALAPLAAAQPESALDRRVHDLALELRCLVCQNQTLADSHADLAVDLRNQIRERLARGATEQQVVDYLVSRYGDFVLYRPPLKAKTLALWTGPFVLLALGALVLWRRVARRAPPAELSEAERARAGQLLE
ncbi:MAG: cytochrome c-type biogenesis protein [Burkholderiales bacterium]